MSNAGIQFASLDFGGHLDHRLDFILPLLGCILLIQKVMVEHVVLLIIVLLLLTRSVMIRLG